MLVPDWLSQDYLPNTEEDDKALEYQVYLLVSNLPVSRPKLREIQNATENDQVVQKLRKLMLDGFPDSKSSMPPELIPYFQVHSELSITEGLIFKGDKIVILSSLRKEMKERIHMGHMGIKRCNNNSSYQFKRFAKEGDFTHDHSSPKYAKSNGIAKSAVKTVKGVLKKMH